MRCKMLLKKFQSSRSKTKTTKRPWHCTLWCRWTTLVVDTSLRRSRPLQTAGGRRGRLQGVRRRSGTAWRWSAGLETRRSTTDRTQDRPRTPGSSDWTGTPSPDSAVDRRTANRLETTRILLHNNNNTIYTAYLCWSAVKYRPTNQHKFPDSIFDLKEMWVLRE